MRKLSRKKEFSGHNERKFPFVVQIAVPDGGFGCTLDAINAWHFYSKHGQRLGRRQEIGEQQFWRWCFEKQEIAEHFRRRFGGEMVPLVVRQYAKGRPRAARTGFADVTGCGPGDRAEQQDEPDPSPAFAETFNQNEARS